MIAQNLSVTHPASELCHLRAPALHCSLGAGAWCEAGYQGASAEPEEFHLSGVPFSDPLTRRVDGNVSFQFHLEGG